jgi:hypothetical protein
MVRLVCLKLSKQGIHIHTACRAAGWEPGQGRRLMLEQWPNNPEDDGNALAGVLHAVLVEAVVVGLVVLLWWWWVAIVP